MKYYRAELRDSGVFSTLMSLSPVFAAFSGLIVLHEQLTHYQWLAIMFIIVSSIGTVLTMYH